MQTEHRKYGSGVKEDHEARCASEIEPYGYT